MDRFESHKKIELYLCKVIELCTFNWTTSFYFYWILWNKRTLFFFNCSNIELDSESDRRLSPNLILKDNDSQIKFTTQFTTPRMTDNYFYCIKEKSLWDQMWGGVGAKEYLRLATTNTNQKTSTRSRATAHAPRE